MNQLEGLLQRVSEVARKEEEINLMMLEDANQRIKKVEDYLNDLGIKKKFYYSEKQGDSNDPCFEDADGYYVGLEWMKDKNKKWRIFYLESNVNLVQDEYQEFNLQEKIIKEVPLLEASSNIRISYGREKLEKFLLNYINETQTFIHNNSSVKEKNDEL